MSVSDSNSIRRTVPRDRAAGADAVRFKREIAFAASRLEHPNIVPLLSAGEQDGELYYTMERVEGETLEARLARNTKSDSSIPMDEALRILRDIARGLANGHGYGILHRALKPSVVVLTPDAAMISEFGVVRALDLAKGTPPDPRVDNRTDIHDFGVLAYEVLTGDAPLGDAPTLISKRRTDAPHTLATLITRAMAPDPDDRPETASEIASAIDEIISPSDSIFGQLGAMAFSSTVEARSNYYRARGALGLAIIAVVAMVAGYFTWKSTQTPSTAVALPPNAIAVLPFANASADSSTNYLASGVTDEVAASVARLPNMTVSSRDAMDAAVGVFGSDSKQIGARLQVNNILGGSVQRIGGDVKLSAQLTDVGAAKMLISKTYTGKFENLSRLEDSLERDVGVALKIPTASLPKAALGPTSVASARDAYLRGRFAQLTVDENNLRRAIDNFGRAAHDDPRFVAAWAGLAQSWAMLSDDFVSPKEAVPQLRDAVAHGLALDTADASLRVLHGVIAFLYDRDAKAAQNYMSPALNGDVATPPALALLWFPVVLLSNGYRDSATAYLKRVIARDSTSPGVLTDAWNYARGSGDALRSIEYCGKLRGLRASAWCDLWQQLDIGQGDDAAAAVERQLSGAGVRHVNAQLDRVNALVAAKRLDEAKRIVGDVDRAAASAGSYMRPDDVALMHAALGDSTGALPWWDRAAADGSSGVGALYWSTARSATRTDPRLAAFATRVGVQPPPSYWPH